jgi:hypothetical protein
MFYQKADSLLFEIYKRLGLSKHNLVSLKISTSLQVTLTTAACLANIAAAMSFGHSAVLLPELQKANSTFTIDEYIGSWIGKYVPNLSMHVPIKDTGYFACVSAEICG